MSAPRNAVEFDQWLAELTDEQFAALKANVPTGFADQLHAARTEGVRTAERVLKNPSKWVNTQSVPDWVRLGMYDALLGWFSGSGTTCMHNPMPGRPEPVVAAAYKPGLVTCGSCTHLLVVRGQADRTCDGCGRVCTGTGDDLIRPVIIFVGVLGYMFGVCRDCDKDLP